MTGLLWHYTAKNQACVSICSPSLPHRYHKRVSMASDDIQVRVCTFARPYMDYYSSKRELGVPSLEKRG